MSSTGIRIESRGSQRPDEPPNVPAFAGAIEHLLAEFDWLLLLLRREVLRLRSAGLSVEDQFRGLYVSDEQVDVTLRPDSSAAAHIGPASALNPNIAEQRDYLDHRVKATIAAGVDLPLEQLAATFGLDAFERLVLAASVAPEVDLRFETLYSYAQNDVNRKRPTPDLLLRMYCDSASGRLHLRAAFSAGGRLVRNQLIRLAGDPHQPEQSTLSRPLRPDERIVEYVLAHDAIDDRLRDIAAVVEPSHGLSGLRLPPTLLQSLANSVTAFADSGAVLFFSGPAGTGKRAAAEALSLETGRRLLIADLREALTSAVPFPELIAVLHREADLQEANLFLTHAEVLSEEHADAPRHRRELEQRVAASGRLVFVGTENPCLELRTGAHFPTLWFEFPVPTFKQRVCFWKDAIRGTSLAPAARVDVAALANRYVLTGGEIHAAAREGAHRARLSGGSVPEPAPELGMEELEAAARSQSNQGLRRMAQKVSTVYGWNDLILPPRALQQLHEVSTAERYRQVVYSEWGFDRRLALGKGLNVLFWGPSGTGKTMAAGILARELGLDLYKIDLSTVVSKYIGETEKQLSRIFRQAQSSNAILFFDEADALFGKRTEVKDAHDRYANVEVSYLLQKMEEYEGIVVLATNYRKNMDDAFVRRMHHIIEFPFPEAEYRERIWTTLVPPEAPLDSDVDFRFLARQFDLAGGNIRNVVLAAAFYAAGEARPIRMEHFILGTSRELQKMGKLPSRADFREYFELIRSRA